MCFLVRSFGYAFFYKGVMFMKKTLSVIMALVMIVTVFYSLPFRADAAQLTSGLCGYNATYTFDACTGELTIKGSGRILTNLSPFSNNKAIKSIVIENGITEIDMDVFSGCSNLERVSFPKTLWLIGNSAFYGCSKLCNVVFPKSLKEISGYAFCGCGLESVVIPKSVEVISRKTFSCYELKNIEIKADSITIDYLAFEGSEYFEDVNNWENGCLYISNHLIFADESLSESYKVKNKTKTIAECAFAGSKIKKVTIPESVKIIGSEAFANCRKLSSVKLQSGLKEIGSSAFANCPKLKKISIPDSVRRIGSGAFNDTGCYKNKNNWKNKSLYISKHLISVNQSASGAYIIKAGTKTIADQAFAMCTKLTSVKIPNGVKTIGYDAFEFCGAMKKVSLPNSLETISSFAFCFCSSLTSISIPKNVKKIEETAFERCKNLKTIKVAKGNKTYNSKNNCNAIIETKTKKLIVGCSRTVIPNNIKIIGCSAFCGSGIRSIKIPKSVETIESYAFSTCQALKEIKLPSSLTTIEFGAFENCYELKSIKIPKKVKVLGDITFRNCKSLKSVYIPKSVKYIKKEAFADCTKLKDIYYAGNKNDWANVKRKKSGIGSKQKIHYNSY